MAAVIGALRVNLGMNSAAFNKGIDAASRRMAGVQKRFEKISTGLTSAGRRMSIGITAPIVALATASVAAQKKQEQAIAAVDAALASMGDTAGFTSDQLQSIASSLQDSSLYGDEEILQKVTANLLTFGNIADDVFIRAQQSAVDLSARLGQDLQSSTVLLGKALNDPVAGLSALTRVGVSFTEQQKDQIKAMAEAGDVAGAQRLILVELEKQYKGQAEALANTDSGKLTQAMNALGDASERIGAILLPVLADVAQNVTALAERFSELSPEFQRGIVIVGGLAAALGPVAIALGGVVGAIKALLPVLALVASPVGAVVAVVAGLSTAAYILWTRWDDLVAKFPAIGKVAEIAAGAFDVVWQAVKNFVSFVTANVRLTIDTISALFRGEWAAAFAGAGALITNLVDAIFPGLQALGAKVAEGAVIVVTALADMASAAGTAFIAALAKIAEAIPGVIAELTTAIGEAMGALVDRMITFGADVVDGFVQGFKDKVASAKAAVTGFGDDVGGWFKAKLGINSPSKVFAKLSGFVIDGFVQGFAAKINSARRKVEEFGLSVSGWFKSVLGIRSPSRVFEGHGANVVDGLVGGIEGNLNRAKGAAAQLGTAVGEAASDALAGSVTGFGESLGAVDLSRGFSGLFGEIRSRGSAAFQDLLSSALSGGGISAITGGLKGAVSGVVSGVTGLFSGGGLGALKGAFSAAMPIIGAIQSIGSLISTFRTSEVTGAGLRIGVQDGGLAGGTYQTKKTSTFWGLFSSSNTQFKAFKDDVAEGLQDSLEAVQANVRDIFDRAGVSVSGAMIDGFNFALQKIDTRDLSDREIQDKIATVFSGYADALSEAVGGVGLQAAATFADVRQVLAAAGQGFYGAFSDMAAAAGDLADGVGGVGQLATKVSAFAGSFFTDIEKQAVLQRQVGDVFDRLNFAVPATNEEFKRLVLSQNLMTKSGREAYSALLDIAPAFDALTGASSALSANFDLSAGGYASAFDDRIAQISAARGYDVARTIEQNAALNQTGALRGLLQSSNRQSDLTERLLAYFERWDVEGLEVRS